MKPIALAALAALLFCSLLQANPLEQQEHPKITKNEAEHIALKKFPGAHVAAAKLEKVRDELVWTLTIAKENGRSQQVAVNAMTGRVAPAEQK